MSTIPDPVMLEPVIPDAVIPNSGLARVKAIRPVKRSRPRDLAANVTRVATFPAIVALGLTAMAFERLRHQFDRGRRQTG